MKEDNEAYIVNVNTTNNNNINDEICVLKDIPKRTEQGVSLDWEMESYNTLTVKLF